MVFIRFSFRTHHLYVHNLKLGRFTYRDVEFISVIHTLAILFSHAFLVPHLHIKPHILRYQTANIYYQQTKQHKPQANRIINIDNHRL